MATKKTAAAKTVPMDDKAARKKALDTALAQLERDFGGIVRAVVRYHNGAQMLFGIILSLYAVKKIADHRLFVSCGDENCDVV